MTRILLFTAMALALSACGEAAAPDAAPSTAPRPPSATADNGPLQSGLWETATYDEAEGGAPDISRVCVGEDEKGSPEDALANFDDPDCKVSRSKTQAGATIRAECVKDGVKFVTDTTWTAHRTTYAFSLITKAEMPGGGIHESRITAKGRRLGPCPAGMAPGATVSE